MMLVHWRQTGQVTPYPIAAGQPQAVYDHFLKKGYCDGQLMDLIVVCHEILNVPGGEPVSRNSRRMARTTIGPAIATWLYVTGNKFVGLLCGNDGEHWTAVVMNSGAETLSEFKAWAAETNFGREAARLDDEVVDIIAKISAREAQAATRMTGVN
jgi:hypothetical protein